MFCVLSRPNDVNKILISNTETIFISGVSTKDMSRHKGSNNDKYSRNALVIRVGIE